MLLYIILGILNLGSAYVQFFVPPFGLQYTILGVINIIAAIISFKWAVDESNRKS
jgi:hypothetical protein